MNGRLLVGTSGFSYPEWKGSFYPADLKDKAMLSYYSTRLSSVEINYTFRRFPSESTLEKWRNQVGEGFLITLKANQRISHRKKLKDAGQDVADFVRVAQALGPALGVILVQCPPYLRYDRALLEEFLEVLPREVRFALEFRHGSWNKDEVLELLAGHGNTALCVADTGERPDLHRTAPFVYVRMRDEEIDPAGLESWAETIGEALEEGDAFVYFKHEGLGGVQAAAFRKLCNGA